MVNSESDDWGEYENDDNNENKNDRMNEEFRKGLDEFEDDDDVNAFDE